MRTLPCLLLGLTISCSAHAADNLLSLYQRAVLNSPELMGSEYALEIAKAREDQAFGKLLPNISATGNYSYNDYQTKHRVTRNSTGQVIGDNGGGSQYPGQRAALNIQQPLFDMQSYLMVKSQKELTAQSEQDVLAAHQQLIFDLVDRYVDALDAADKSQIIEDELHSTEKQFSRVEAMQARQMAMVTDKYELQARVETLRTNLIDSDNDARIALEKLRELTGDAVIGIQPIRLNAVQSPPDGTIEQWTQQAVHVNPELESLRHALEAAKKSISSYQAGHLPRFDLQLSETYSNTTIYNISSSSEFTVGTASVQATIPIYSGGITSAQTDEAQARKRLSEARLEQKLRELEKLTRAAYLDMATAPARNMAADRQLAASEKSRDAMQKGYELGVVTIVDLLNAQEHLSEAKRVQHQARYRYFKARVALFQQAGRLVADEITQLNGLLTANAATAKEETKVKEMSNKNDSARKSVIE